MKLRKVNPNKIMVPEVRVTAQFDEETLALFKATVKEMGQLVPILCAQVGEDLVLIDGLHRVNEAISNKVLTIDVAVIEGDMVDVLTQNILVDHLRGKTPPSQMVKVIEVLWKEYQLDSEKIATKTGLPRDYVEKLQSVSMLTPLCREELDQGHIGIGEAFALTKLKDPSYQEVALGQQLIRHWKLKDFEGYIKDLLELLGQKPAIKVQQAERPPYKIKCVYCGGDFDITEIANPPTCKECSATLLLSMAEARRQVTLEASAKVSSTIAPP